jgi:hypothetical protein
MGGGGEVAPDIDKMGQNLCIHRLRRLESGNGREVLDSPDFEFLRTELNGNQEKDYSAILKKINELLPRMLSRECASDELKLATIQTLGKCLTRGDTPNIKKQSLDDQIARAMQGWALELKKEIDLRERLLQMEG